MSCGVNPIIDLDVERLEQFAVGLRGEQRTVLGTEVRASHLHDRYPLADRFMNSFEVAERNLALLLENLVDVIRPRTQTHIPLVYGTNPSRVFERQTCDSERVAEPRAPETGDYGSSGCF